MDFITRILARAFPPKKRESLGTTPQRLGIFDLPYAKRAYGLIDFKELDFTDLSEEDRGALAAQADGSRKTLEVILKEIIKAQINKWSRAAWKETDLAFHNGGMNMADLILETLENLSVEHLKNQEPTPTIDPTVPALSSGSEMEML